MANHLRNRIIRRFSWFVIIFFLLLNAIAYFHAYRFTHFSSTLHSKTEDPKNLGISKKIRTAFFGVENPRPIRSTLPNQYFETISLKSNKQIHCWLIRTQNAKGTVILFHGYGADKSSLIPKSDEFIKLGYNTMLVDFMGSGGSEGNQTTIGYKEAEEVKSAFDFVQSGAERNIYLFGTSMGAVAVMKAISDYNLQPRAILIECPFGSMYKTTCARFRLMHMPVFPMAGLLVFWGGVQNGFWAFGHNPIDYAKKIDCPTLLLYGGMDEKVSRTETGEIYLNLRGRKHLVVFPFAGHENYLTKYKDAWVRDISEFLAQFDQPT